MKKIIAQKNDSGQRLDKFILKFTDNMPKNLLYKAFRKKRIKVNGKKQEGAYILCEGDVLELYINDEFFKAEGQSISFSEEPCLDIIYEDENVLIINKPKGVVMHGEKNDKTTLLYNLLSYLYCKKEYIPEKEQSFTPAFCNRIDKNTQGIVIAAKNAAALRGINEKIKNGQMRKFYLCTLSKRPAKDSDTICTYLKKNEHENKVYVCGEDENGAKYAKTKYKVLKETDEGILTEVELFTGRTHQIRAHMAHIGAPISGDVKYGAAKNGKKDYQDLTSYKIIFDFEKDDTDILSSLAGKSFSITQNNIS